MNRAKAKRSEAENARIDAEISHILAAEDELLPTSGFASEVMERVRQEAAQPAPIPFPWMKAIPVFLLAGGGIVWSAFEMVHFGLPGSGLTAIGQSIMSWWTISLPPLSGNLMRSIEEAGWVALALGSSLASWLVARRLAGRGGLL